MELKTKVNAEEGRQDLTITRDFDLPVDLLFRAYVEADLIEQWMGNKVLKLDSKRHGSYQYEATDPKGNKHRFSGTIHDVVADTKIIRTFEMEGTPFGVQLEVYEFVKVTEHTSRLDMHVIYESVAQRNEVLKMPFKQGINWAHNRLEEVVGKVPRP